MGNGIISLHFFTFRRYFLFIGIMILHWGKQHLHIQSYNNLFCLNKLFSCSFCVAIEFANWRWISLHWVIFILLLCNGTPRKYLQSPQISPLSCNHISLLIISISDWITCILSRSKIHIHVWKTKTLKKRQKDNTRSQTNRRSFSFLADCLPCSDMQAHRNSRNHNFLWGEICGKCGKRKHTKQSLPRPPKLWYASSQQQH